MRILVVDDEPDTRTMLRGLLRVWGHEVSEAADAAEALRLAEAVCPEVALVDVGLPGADGFTLAAQLRALDTPPTVVMLTGQSGDEKLQQAHEAGARHYLVKPADPVLLRGLLGSIRYGKAP